MPLPPGHKVGPYEIVAPLGAGGMGEVYRAKDSKLKREVALKVLPEDVASDRERLARFQREAEVLASLNHPHIAHLYGIEDNALVMELVEGEDLADRIRRGPIAIDEALPIARQIAEALEAAHDAGIVHRDLKPANVKVRPDGTVKVLDFGLAKALERAPSLKPQADSTPTITSPAMTMQGVILGTAAYMAPEQAKGRVVDRRTDIWAFGCVLFEMLAGKRTFAGDDVSDTLVSILRDDPPWAALPSSTPPHVRLLLRRCLQKDPQKRLPHIGAARIELADADTGGLVQGTPPDNRWRIAAVLGAIAGAAAVGLVVWLMRPVPGTGERGAIRFAIEPLAGHVFPGASAVPRFSLSPDGRHIVYQMQDDKASHLWIRALDSLEPRPLAGTRTERGGLAAQQPFWSPDGRYLAYFDEAAAELKKLDRDSGLVQTITRVSGNQFMGTWNDSGTILLSTLDTKGIMRVPATGGEPVRVTSLDAGRKEVAHLWPDFLPDGRHFVYQTLYSDAAPMLYIGSLDGGAARRLMASLTMARVIWPDRLAFIQDDALLTQRLDLTTFALAGEPELVAKGVQRTPSGRIGVSASQTGAFAYSTGIAEANLNETRWLSRAGGTLTTAPPSIAAAVSGVRLSPDGRSLVFGRGVTGERGELVTDIWIQDTLRGIETRVTAGTVSPGVTPLFSPDGARVLIRQVAEMKPTFVDQPLSMATPGPILFTGQVNENVVPLDWSRDGQRIVFFRSGRSADERGLWILPVPGGSDPVEYLRAPIRYGAAISPDGRWLAYGMGWDRAQSQIFIQPFPNPSGGRWPVSAMGGAYPRWRPDGKELYFIASDTLMAAPVTTSPKVEIGAVTPLFPMPPSQSSTSILSWASPYDVSPDGTRFVVLRPRLLTGSRVQLIVTIPPQ